MAYSFRNPSDGIIKHYLETSKIIAVVDNPTTAMILLVSR